MSLRMPESMDECIYFTNRPVGKGKVIAWVYRKACPKCKKAQMGKPVEKGKVKTRANEYVCPNCGYTEEKNVHEESLHIEAKFTCPSCGKEGEATAPYVRKPYQGIPSYILLCPHCGTKVPVTKKMKKKKGEPDEDEE